MREDQLTELLYQALETEQGGVQVYHEALNCAVNEDLKREWQKYRDQTENHIRVLTSLFETFKLDPFKTTPGRLVLRGKIKALVDSMRQARIDGGPEAAQLFALEGVFDVETKDHLNWELLSTAARALEGERAQALGEACGQVEDEEDEHLYHTQGWLRELWFDSLGLQAPTPAAAAKNLRRSVPRDRARGRRATRKAQKT
jgi:rubrerythrin